ncbi:uncharacterized protein LOC110447074 [Mizuhopecten yessoensis]|uniref:Uncharacterized protein n=1 Tax=Mizuhopecten yessoensis TaxID=6573 RepID=A0A210QW14_MIZYE|nr:uncharacterized protein LOC110447074 [Mizuhopecten yessoensis]OWF52950.1 hypothetical protein KP79_PYT06473 [Mizuhopecten yessoensis]
MAEDSITKLCRLLEDVKTQINIVEGELAYNNNRDEYDFGRKLSAKSEKMELVKKSLEALSLKANNLPIRESRGRTAGSSSDSGYNSACSERRHALFLKDGDLPEPEQQCSVCRQQMKTPMQVTDKAECTPPARRSTENDDSSEFQSG